jgi:uncharacterized membrane protein YvbJ
MKKPTFAFISIFWMFIVFMIVISGINFIANRNVSKQQTCINSFRFDLTRDDATKIKMLLDFCENIEKQKTN